MHRLFKTLLATSLISLGACSYLADEQVSTHSLQANYEWGSEFESLPTPPQGQSWQINPQHTDEFDHWDSTKWQALHKWWNGSSKTRPGAYVEADHMNDTENVDIKNSVLYLYAKPNGPSAEKWVGTSVVSSKQPISYGYYEVKMKASMLATTSAFWMQGRFSEIDVIEAIGAPKKGAKKFGTSLMTNYHHFPNGFGKPGYSNGAVENPAIKNSHGLPDGAAHDWHTYGIWWVNEKEAYFYLDGKRVDDFHVAKTGEVTDRLIFPAPFDETMTLFLDTEVWNWGDGKPGTPTLEELSATDGSNAMQVEWVRAYQLTPMQ
ncbi:family 16 glycosylhydrolase [Algibacillus agarilyticus]|uniref:family 16 glycosylhydrolase n=1 Tax=Algibacillus agarilyticus TaxID=2234133 RepID=UPI000DD03CD0|nr:family 16 glycosylhydrolase [Algibacillus agarilyticus]